MITVIVLALGISCPVTTQVDLEYRGGVWVTEVCGEVVEFGHGTFRDGVLTLHPADSTLFKDGFE